MLGRMKVEECPFRYTRFAEGAGRPSAEKLVI